MARKNSRSSRQKDKLRKQQQRMQVQQTFQYQQVDKSWRNNIISRLDIPVPRFSELDHTSVQPIPLTKPTMFYKIRSDGNCFFNALSYTVTGSEEHHFLIRQKICESMKTYSQDIKFLLPLECKENINTYLTSSKMEQERIWATEIEIMAASILLQTTIFIYSKSGVHWTWMKHSPNVVTHNKAIYLFHRDENHYDVVVAIENSDVLDIVPSHECYTFSQLMNKYQSNSEFKKRKQKQCRMHQNKKYKADESFADSQRKATKKRYWTSTQYQEQKKLTDSKRYWTSPQYHDQKKVADRKRYWTSPQYREQKKLTDRKRYWTSEKYQQQKKQSTHIKYCTNSVFRSHLRNMSKEKYLENTAHRNRVKWYSMKKYSQNSTHKDRVKQYSKEKYSKEIAHRDKAKQYSIKKYSQDNAHRDNVKQYSMKKYSQNSTHKDRVKQYSIKKYSQDKAHRDKVKQYSIKKYSQDNAHRDKVKQYSCQKYTADRVHREKVKHFSKAKYRRYTSFRNHMKASSIKKYSKDPLFRANLKKYLRDKYYSSPSIQKSKKQRVVNSRKSVIKCVSKFRKNIRNTPHFVCLVCIRMLYRKQVKECKRQRYFVDGELHENAARCLTADNHNCDELMCNSDCILRTLKNDKQWICHTCDTHLRKGLVPPQAYINDLTLPPIPPVLKRLNVLERQLISLRIPFMKLLSLPRGGQKGMKGPVVNVPSDLTSVTTCLPRNINDAQLIKVKLKRKLSYRSYYTYQWINPTNVLEALQYLKEHNSFYENITLDHQWINDINNSELVKPVDNNESSDDDEEELSEKDYTIPVETCFQPIDIGQDILDANKTLCIAPAENQNPQNIFREEGSDIMAFPTLLPDGHFGLFEQREIKLTPSKYFNARLFSADNRFATNKEYLFFAQYVTELNYISSNISLALRKGKESTDDGKNLTASMILNSNNISKILKSDSGYRFLQPVRGTPPYWQRTMKDIYAMIRQLGIPTWFVTFSAAEMRWEEVVETLLYINNDDRKVEDIEWSERCTMVNDNPVLCARMFDHRVKALFSDLLMSPSHPIGQVIDFFYRTEFQQRGSPHIHCLLWIKDAPKLNENTDEEICQFIDRYVTCSLPDKENNPELHDIITSVQIHSKSHSKSCKKYSSACRFNFPRPPVLKTFIARVDEEENFEINDTEMPSEEQFDEMCKTSTRTPKQILRDIWALVSSNDQNNYSFTKILELVNITYSQYIKILTTAATRNTVHLQRKLADVWVNNYNPDLSMAWNANLDIQFVTDSYACVAYILSYISKAEMEMGDLLQNAQKEAEEGNVDAVDAMRKIGHAYLQNRELSAQEAVYRVCGLHLKDCSREVVFIPAGSNIFKMSLPINVIKARSRQEDGNENIWMTSIHDKYYARPNVTDFNDMSLAEFASKYRILSQSQVPITRNTSSLPVYKLQKGLGFIKRRRPGKEAVIRFPRFNIRKNANEYFLTALQVYIPHRKQITLPDTYADYVDYVATGLYNGKEISKIIAENQHHFELDAQNLDKAWQDLQDGRVHEDMWASVAPETEAERLETSMEKSVENMDESEPIPELTVNHSSSSSNSFSYQIPKVSQKALQEALRNMNDIQQTIFYKVRNWCLQLLWNKQPDPFHLFLTGGAGTGKSHLIRCIYHEATRILSKHSNSPDSITVLLTAPTGTAAFNIDGLTIHSAFSLNKNIKLPYQPLTENSLNILRSKLDCVQILIIDEISMVDHKILSYIHGRLSQIKHSKKPFGNISVLAVGDFYQLPPVRGNPLFKTKDSNFSDLLNPYFKVATLTEVMRQKDDGNFAHMLNRLRTHTHGTSLLPVDLDALKTVSYDHTPSDAEDVLHIFATNKDVNKHNDTMIEKKCSPVYISLARDFYRDIITGKMCQKDNPYSNCAAEDLQTTLKLGVGARIMLTRNLDTEDGLVNGAFGMISSIQQDSSKQITAVYVEFDNEKIGQKHRSKTVNLQSNRSVKIEMFEDSLRGKQVSRKQFPLKLGYAATIHKTQGMTVNSLVVSMKGIFQPGMAYVALSRATTMSGLRILNFDYDTIYSSNDITEALQKMPKFLPEEVPVPESSPEILKIILHNTEGLLPHLSDIQDMKKFTTADIVCFTETWLPKNGVLPPKLFEKYKYFLKSRKESYIPNKTVFKNLSNAERGGVAEFIRETISHSEFIFKTKNLEAVGIITHKPVKMCILTVYRPPGYPLQLFKDQLLQVIDEVQQLDILSIIVGDFNDNVIQTNNTKLVQSLSRYGYSQLVDKPTTEAGTCLDLVFVNRLSSEIQIRLLPTYYSFHDAIEIIIPVERV